MSVEECLGLAGDGELLAQADAAWTVWCSQHPSLGIVTDTCALRSWLRQASTEAADELLLVLAQLAARDGGDDSAAAAVLAWALMPGASILAGRLRTLTPRIDQVVAAQLWLEVRTFPWRRLTKVSANILLNTRAAVLLECGAQSQLRRSDVTWSRTNLVDPYEPFWGMQATPEPSCGNAADELLELLEWACAADVISSSDRSLLLCLVEAAEQSSTTRTGRCGAGLMANETSERVAVRMGISDRTLRRRTRRSIDALSDAYAEWKASA